MATKRAGHIPATYQQSRTDADNENYNEQTMYSNIECAHSSPNGSITWQLAERRVPIPVGPRKNEAGARP